MVNISKQNFASLPIAEWSLVIQLHSVKEYTAAGYGRRRRAAEQQIDSAACLMRSLPMHMHYTYIELKLINALHGTGAGAKVLRSRRARPFAISEASLAHHRTDTVEIGVL